MSVKVGSVRIPILPHAKGWRFAWKDGAGRWKHIVRKDRDEIKKLARDKAKEIHDGLTSFTPTSAEVAMLRRMRESGASLLDFEQWLSTRATLQQSLTVAECVTAMVQAKTAAAGKKRRVHDTIVSHLSTFPQNIKMVDVQSTDVEAWLKESRERGLSQRSLQNIRASAITLFRWARGKRMLPQMERTAPEQTDPIEKVGIREDVVIYTPDELLALISAARSIPGDTSSLALLVVMGAFAGLRTEEMAPLSDTKREGLQWEDVDRLHDIIRVRSHIAKTGTGRVLPLHPNLKAWMTELDAPTSGPILSVKLPTAMKALKKAFPGLWKKNALRHSYGTYRTAQTQDMPRVSLEMGNSVEMIKRHYFHATSEALGKAWFEIAPNIR